MQAQKREIVRTLADKSPGFTFRSRWYNSIPLGPGIYLITKGGRPEAAASACLQSAVRKVIKPSDIFGEHGIRLLGWARFKNARIAWAAAETANKDIAEQRIDSDEVMTYVSIELHPIRFADDISMRKGIQRSYKYNPPIGTRVGR